MINPLNEAVTFVAQFTGFREDIVVNWVSGFSVVIFLSVISWFKSKSRFTWKIFYFAILFKITRRIRSNRITPDGFYHAVYDSSESVNFPEKNLAQTDNTTETIANQEDSKLDEDKKASVKKVAECIYIKTSLFSSRMTGYVFRRAQRKNGAILQNDFYAASTIKSSLRLVGSFSETLHIFFGYWLDPYEPDEVAGTVRLKWEDNNIGVQAHQRKVFLDGQWDGINKKLVTPINKNKHEFYGFAETGGIWRFYRIGPNISSLNAWADKLILDGDLPTNPDLFIDWLPK